MHQLARRVLATVALLLAGTAGVAEAQYTAYGLTSTGGVQQLVRFNTSAPAAVATVGATGVTLTGIDFRPATSELYGYDGDKLYKINLATLCGRRQIGGDIFDTAGLQLGPFKSSRHECSTIVLCTANTTGWVYSDKAGQILIFSTQAIENP